MSRTKEVLIKNPYLIFPRAAMSIPLSTQGYDWLSLNANYDWSADPHVHRCRLWILFTFPRTPSPTQLILIRNSIIACGGSIWHGPRPYVLYHIYRFSLNGNLLHCTRTIALSIPLLCHGISSFILLPRSYFGFIDSNANERLYYTWTGIPK